MHEIEETRRIAQREMGLILPSVEAVIPPQVRLGSSEAVSQAGSSHLRAQAHLRHRSLDQVREDGSRLLHGRRRNIDASPCDTNLGLSVTSTTCAGRPSRCEPSLLGGPKEHPKRIG